MSEPKAPTPTPGDTYKGWLFKWTNYIKGYQRRWFVLSNGLLSYYRTQAEMGHTCRGTINLATANIVVEDSCNFVISNGGAQTYHLKASSEVERQRWITALELAKAKAVRMQAESDDSGDECSMTPPPAGQSGSSRNSEVQSTLRTLGSKVEDLSTCNDLIAKHGSALQRSLSELEGVKLGGETGDKIRQVTERATLFRITSNAMINACRDFLALAQAHSKRWQKALQAEREQRVRLEETLEQLAKQHNHLERAFRGATVLPPSQSNPDADGKGPSSGKGDASDEDDENEFFDAMEDPQEFITVPADPKYHRRSGSNVSGISSELGMDDQSIDEQSLASNPDSPQSQELEPVKKRRTRIPDKPNYSLNLWSIMKNCIGKELSKIPMPVNFNEPISMLQRLSEDLEYSELLDKAAKCQSSLEQLCYVAAFTVSSYSTTVHRTGKPFNPLLGETFELDRRHESGYRSLCEQVSHHPPAAAHHAISDRGWTLRQEITLASKFRGKYLSIMPLGSIHCIFEKSENHYTWKKVTTTVHNIIVGKLWIDQSGEIDIINHKTGDRCHLKFAPYSYFSRDVARKVTGVVTDKEGKAHYVLSGTWDEKMEFSRVMQSSRGGENGTEGRQKTVYQTLKAREIWRKTPLPEGAENMYYFSTLALTLNELEDGVAPTDSRRRPDQRMMEQGRWEEANAEKQRLEEKQRTVRREREREAARTASPAEEAVIEDSINDTPLKTDGEEISSEPIETSEKIDIEETTSSDISSSTETLPGPSSYQIDGMEGPYGSPVKSVHQDNYEALWFDHFDDPFTGEQTHLYKGGYWEAKEQGSWENCPDIF
ncbi:oxysterol-binding protein 1 isoform X1 [Alosa sapidissima]|uniref:oxysterol-binding protein 1 isoform X1 n=1 Tax=Alosa sapidissima TaxID=34773 RepID=UPI001C0A4992|nr:oxysterol-binding protein 1 isoform X1 [Alosa sapidissima]